MLELLVAILIGAPMLLLLEPWKPLAVRDTEPDPRFCFSCHSVSSPHGDDEHGFTCGKCEVSGPVELCSDSAQSYFAQLRNRGRLQLVSEKVRRHGRTSALSCLIGATSSSRTRFSDFLVAEVGASLWAIASPLCTAGLSPVPSTEYKHQIGLGSSKS